MKSGQLPLVLVFSTAYRPLVGGAEIAVQETIKRNTDFRFLVLTARFRRDLAKRENGIRRVGFGLIPDKILLPVTGLFTALRIIRGEKQVALWGVMISYGSIAAYFVKLLYPRMPLIITLQEGDSDVHIKRSRLGLINLFWKLILKKADRLIVISNHLKEMAFSYGYRGDITVIPNGVPDYFFETKKKRQAKDAAGVPSDSFTVITVSRLTKKNAVDTLLKGFGLFLKNHGNARLLIVGDGGERSGLVRLADKLGITNRVIFTGTVDYKKLPDFYAAADVFVRPSRSEGLGSSFLEAMAAGIPVIGTPEGGIKDFLKDGITGLVVQKDSPEALKSALERIITDEGLAGDMTKNALNMIMKRYRWEDIAREYSLIFKQVML